MRGKVIVITGASGALGAAVAAEGRAQGADIVTIDHAPAPAGARAFGGVDLSDADAAQRAIDAAASAAGRIDALLNIAGGFSWAKTADAGADLYARMQARNLITALNASRAALAHLIASSGAIVNVGAAGALKAGAGMGAYAASKAGVHKLTEAMAEEYKGQVRVNAVLPSIIDTPQNRKDMPDADPSLWVAPADLARVMLFLASDAARAVTGALLPVTGRL